MSVSGVLAPLDPRFSCLHEEDNASAWPLHTPHELFRRISKTGALALHDHPHPGALDHLADDGARYATLGERADQHGGPNLWHSDEQPSARLRVVEREQVILPRALRRYTILQVLPVAVQSTRVDAVVREWHCQLPDRNFLSVHDRTDTARIQHLRQVAEETVARYVCGRGDADLAHRVAGGLVEEGGRPYGVLDLLLRDDVSLERRRQDAEAEGFGQNQGVSWLGAGVANHPVFFHEAGHGEAVLGLLVLDRVAAAEPRA